MKRKYKRCDKKIKMTRMPEKIWKENPVGWTGEGKRWTGNIWEEWRASKTETISQEVESRGEVSLVRSGKAMLIQDWMYLLYLKMYLIYIRQGNANSGLNVSTVSKNVSKMYLIYI